MKNLISCFLLCAVGLSAIAQEFGDSKFKQKFNKADALVFDGSYLEAMVLLEDLYAYDTTNANLNYLLGVCYLMGKKDHELAIKRLENATRNVSLEYMEANWKERKAPGKAYYYLGKAYHFKNRFDRAVSNYYNYRSFIEMDDVETYNQVRLQIQYAENAVVLIANPVGVEVMNLGSEINTKYPEYCPIVSADGKVLIFTSRRNGGTGGAVDDEGAFYEDIYICHKQDDDKWSKPKSIGANINSAGHEAAIGLSPDGQLLFIYKDDDNDGNIYFSKRTGDDWTKPQPLGPNVNTKSWETHATVNATQDLLIFVSNRIGGYGGRDLWYSKKLPDGQWGLAQNMGSVLNSQYEEDSPFITANGKTLIFSSQGHTSMGGFDIFRTEFVDGVWTPPENIGYPINTSETDIFFSLTPDGRHAYYSSRMESGFGETDLYKLRLDSEKTSGVVVARGKVKIPARDYVDISAKIEVKDEEGVQIGVYRPNPSTGYYVMVLDPGETYSISYEADGYDPILIQLPVSDEDNYADNEGAIELVDVVFGEDILALQAEKARLEKEKEAAAGKIAENEQLAAEAAKIAQKEAEELALNAAKDEERRKAELLAEQDKIEAEEALAEELAALEKTEQERLLEEKAASEKAYQENLLAEQAAAEKEERLLAEQVASEKEEQEHLLAAKAASEKAYQENLLAEQAATEKLEQERLLAEQAALEKEEQERLLAEQVASEKEEQERLLAEKAATEKLEQERLLAEQAAAEKEEQERLLAEQAASEKEEQERLLAEQAASEKVEQERLLAEQAASEKEEQERLLAEQERLLAEQAATEKLEQERLVAEQAATEKEEQERLLAEQVASEKIGQERLAADEQEKTTEQEYLSGQQEEPSAEYLQKLQQEEEAERLAAAEAKKQDIQARIDALKEKQQSQEQKVIEVKEVEVKRMSESIQAAEIDANAIKAKREAMLARIEELKKQKSEVLEKQVLDEAAVTTAIEKEQVAVVNKQKLEVELSEKQEELVVLQREIVEVEQKFGTAEQELQKARNEVVEAEKKVEGDVAEAKRITEEEQQKIDEAAEAERQIKELEEQERKRLEMERLEAEKVEQEQRAEAERTKRELIQLEAIAEQQQQVQAALKIEEEKKRKIEAAEKDRYTQEEALSNAETLDELRVLNSQLIAENQELKVQLADLNRKLELILERLDYSPDIQKLELPKSSTMKNLQEGRRLILRNIFFDYNRASLRTKSKHELNKLYGFMKQNPDVKIVVSGHTDSRGNDDYNMRLSKDRAQAVVDYLVRNGVSGSRLSAVGFGETRPIARNENPDLTDNPTGRQLNRRIEISLPKGNVNGVEVEQIEVPKDARRK